MNYYYLELTEKEKDLIAVLLRRSLRGAELPYNNFLLIDNLKTKLNTLPVMEKNKNYQFNK